jgi:hypothetical protein
MDDIDLILDRLSHSKFRNSFRLKSKELEYLNQRGMGQIMEHASGFIDSRIAPADPDNDGKQTPYRNHPVFIAQHATATCCRGCIEKWHNFKKGLELDTGQKEHILKVIKKWLELQVAGD